MKMKVQTMIAASLIAGGSAVAGDKDWQYVFDLGVTMTNGNSDSILATAGLAVSREVGKHEYDASLSYTYGEESSETTNDEVLADAAWNYLISEYSYSGLRFEFRRDDLADIDYRASLSGVLGRYFIKTEETQLSAEVGFGATFESLGEDSSEYMNVYIGEKFEHALNDQTSIYQNLKVTAPVDELDNFSLIAEAGLRTSLTDKLSLKVYVEDKYEAQPATGRKHNDFKFVTGVTYKF